jgi:2'-5' RNA ligase
MRLFAAIVPPAAVADEVDAVVRERLAALPGAGRLRWTERVGWHITVAYYGETPEPEAAELRERLAAVAGRRAPFELRLAGGESLREWALGTGVAGDREILTVLAAEAAALRPHADQYDTYRPHLTLARNVRVRDGDGDRVAFATYVEALRTFTGSPWRVGELALMAGGSEDSTPHRYTTTARCPLAGVLPWTG